MSAIRVVVGEDSYLMREGIRRVLDRAAGIELVALYGDLHSLQAAIDADPPDVVMTDIRMPPASSDEGIRLAAALRVSHPRIGVVVLSQHVEPEYAMTLFANGSARRAYLLKERVRDPVELERAIRAVADGGSVVDPFVVDELLRAQRAHERSPLESLTRRELEILGMITEGRSNSAIADTLVVTKRAVERHINGIFTKLELGDPGDVSRRVKATLVYLADPSE